MLTHCVLKERLLPCRFAPSVDEQAAVRQRVSPLHGKGHDAPVPIVRQHRHGIRRENLARLDGDAAPIQLIDDAAKFARVAIIGKEKTPAHVQSLPVQPCGGCFIIRALRLR